MTTENGLIITPVTGGETRSYVTNPNEWMGNVHAETDPVTGGISFTGSSSTFSANLTVLPSGFTDATDATAINAAIASLSTAGGGVIELMQGTYTMTTAILIKSNVWLRGKGESTILKLASDRSYSTSSNVLLVFASSADIENWAVSDLALNGNRASQSHSSDFTTDNAGNGFYISGGGGYKVKHFHIFNVSSYGNLYHGGIIVGGTQDFRIEGCKFHDNGFRGFHIHGSDTAAGEASDFEVLNNRVYTNGQDQAGATANGAANLRSGLYCALSNGQRGSVIGNTIYNEKGVGLEISGYVSPDTAPYAANNVTFSGNTIYDCGLGVKIADGAKLFSFVGNTIKDCNVTSKGASATGEGISFAGAVGGSLFSVSGNVISGNYGSGIIFNSGTNIWTDYSICGNVISGNGNATTNPWGIRIAGSTRFVCADNNINMSASTTGYGLYCITSNNGVFHGNTSDTGSNNVAAFLSESTASNISVFGNFFKRSAGNALVVQSATTAVFGNLLGSGNTVSITGTTPYGPAFHYSTTGAVTPTLGTNAPTGVTTPQAWLPVLVAGTVRYIPAW